MKKLSAQYGKHLALINNQQEMDNEATRLGKCSDQIYNQSNFGICDIIGNYDHAFIIVHSHGKLYLVDQHAASEKSLYVQFIKGKQLFPVQCHGTNVDIENIYLEVLKEQKQRLKELGWDYKITSEGPVMFNVELLAVPSLIGKKSSPSDFIDIIQELYCAQVEDYSQGQKQSLASTACHTAYRVGHKLSNNEMRGLLDSLQLMNAAFNCPHGRPIIVGMGSISELVAPLELPVQYPLL